MADPLTDYGSNIMGSFSGIVGTTVSLVVKILGGLVALGIVGFFLFWRKQQKQYNIPVTIWIPRSDGKITDEVQAKGGFFAVKPKDGGKITSFRLKRKGLGSIDIPPPNSRFLVGLSRRLYLIQKGIDDFEPVLPDSFRYVTTAKGKKIPVVNLNCINQDATAWVEDFRESAKRRFSFHNVWDKYKDFIQMTVFIFIVMLAIYIMWQGLQEVVIGLKEVAQTLQGGSVNIK